MSESGTRDTKQLFYRQIWKLVLPMLVQNLLSAAVSSADVLMLNYVGQSAISAVSLASQYSGVLFSFFYGIGTGVTMLSAQYYGKKDFYAIHMVQAIAMRFSLLATMIFSGFSLMAPQLMMKVFTKDPELIALGSSYLRIMSITFICWSIIEVYLSSLRSIGRVTICMVLNVLAFTVNVILNACFIFGLFGFPKWGVTGVAIATAASRLLELVGCVVVSLFSKDVKLRPLDLLKKNKVLSSDFIRMSLPALCNDLAWGVAFSLYSAILGHLSSDVVAANSIVTVVRNLGTVFCYGIASAGGIMLGNVMGEGKLDVAKDYASKLIRLTILSGVIGGLVVLAISPIAMSYARITETAMHYLKYMLLINSYYIMGTAVNTLLIAGVFRAGGDSKFGFVCDVIDMWGYAIPVGFLAAFVLKLPVLVVYFLLCTDEFVKWPWVLKHYKSGKWLKNITRDNLENQE